MPNLRLTFEFTDRAGRGVYSVEAQHECPTCGFQFWKKTGQRLRFDLDGNLHIRLQNVLIEEAPDGQT